MRTRPLLLVLIAVAVLSASIAAAQAVPPIPPRRTTVHPQPSAEQMGVPPSGTEPDMPSKKTPKPEASQRTVLVGSQTREKVEEAVPDWVGVEVASSPDPHAAKSLTGVPRGAEVTVFFGTWCGDSRREVPRLWRALDEAGGTVPFKIEYIAVDEAKKDPQGLAAAADVRYVPTFIVSREGKEVGRIVESAPGGVEQDLLNLLNGRAKGVVSGRSDLGAKPEAEKKDEKVAPPPSKP